MYKCIITHYKDLSEFSIDLILGNIKNTLCPYPYYHNNILIIISISYYTLLKNKIFVNRNHYFKEDNLLIFINYNNHHT